MTISRISSATNNGTTVTIGTHAANDTILMFAYNDGANTIPTVPSGWYGLIAIGGSSTAITIGWKQAATASETSGTWTNADTLTAVVYRGGSNTIILPKVLTSNGATSVTQTFGSQLTGSFDDNALDLWLSTFITNRNSTNSLDTNVPTGFVNVTSTTDGATWQTAMHDTNTTRTTFWSSTNITVTTSNFYRTSVQALVELAHPSSAGSSFRRVNIRGGANQ